MNVIVLQECHGLGRSVDRLIRILKDYGPRSMLKHDMEYIIAPKETMVLHEAIPQDFHENALRYSANLISFSEFWKQLSLTSHWGPSEVYKKLFRFLHEEGYSLGSLDDILSIRHRLSEQFNDLIHKFQEKGKTDEVMQEFDRLKRRLCWEREEVFTERVDDLQYNQDIKSAVVITHFTHVGRISDYFRNVQKYQMLVPPIDTEEEKEMRREEDELQVRYAKEAEVTNMKYPPLVPIVTMAPW